MRIWDPEGTEPLFAFTGHAYAVSDVPALADGVVESAMAIFRTHGPGIPNDDKRNIARI